MKLQIRAVVLLIQHRNQVYRGYMKRCEGISVLREKHKIDCCFSQNWSGFVHGLEVEFFRVLTNTFSFMFNNAVFKKLITLTTQSHYGSHQVTE